MADTVLLPVAMEPVRPRRSMSCAGVVVQWILCCFLVVEALEGGSILVTWCGVPNEDNEM